MKKGFFQNAKPQKAEPKPAPVQALPRDPNRFWTEEECAAARSNGTPGYAMTTTAPVTVMCRVEPVALMCRRLEAYDGSDPTKPLLLSLRGCVLDVTSGFGFYGPDMPYHCFAGRDASRAFAKHSLESEDVRSDLSGLDAAELEELEVWHSSLTAKYPTRDSRPARSPGRGGRFLVRVGRRHRGCAVGRSDHFPPETQAPADSDRPQNALPRRTVVELRRLLKGVLRWARIQLQSVRQVRRDPSV